MQRKVVVILACLLVCGFCGFRSRVGWSCCDIQTYFCDVGLSLNVTVIVIPCCLGLLVVVGVFVSLT